LPDFLHLGVPAWQLVLRSVAIYAALLIGLRVFGKREVGQFTIFDLVLVLLVANAVQPAMTGPDNSVTGGLIIIISLLVANFGVSRLDRIEFFHRLFTAAPTILVKDGKILAGNLRRENLDRDEIEMAAREHGVQTIEEVKLGVLESDGSISIVSNNLETNHRKRRVRFNRMGS
jgi:uncharacterized membrane protein YcaP (DUF421 family)